MQFPDLRRRRLWLAALHHLAIADGDFSAPEVALLEEELRRELPGVDWDDLHLPGAEALADLHPQSLGCDTDSDPGLLNGLRHWLDAIDPTDPAVARFLVRLIPAQCPFERDVTLFGRKVVHTPPMCKINPLYEQLVALRFRCLCRLAELEASAGA